MKYLLDTHILLWALDDAAKLPQKVRDIAANENSEIYYSIISIWEVGIKRLKHTDKITDLSLQELIGFCAEAGFEELSLTKEHVYVLETLSRLEASPPHNDPFDRILIAQAKADNMLFLTHDENLSFYNEPCIQCV